MSVKTRALSEKLLYIIRGQALTIEEDATLKEALALMRDKRTPCLMVCRRKKLVGIFTERDCLMKVIGKAKPGEPLRKYMTADPITVRLDQTVGEVVEVMDANGLRNLPIIDESGTPDSVVTVSAIIRYLADHFPAAVVNRPHQPHIVSEEMGGA